MSATASPRRRPQPTSKASRARSRFPLRVAGSGQLMSDSACALVNQFPARTPRLLHPGHLVDGGGDPGIEQPVGRRLARQFFNRRQALVDGRRSVSLALQYGAVRLDGGAGEGRTSLPSPPDEIIRQRLRVHRPRAGARDGVEDQLLHLVEGGGRRPEPGPSYRIHADHPDVGFFVGADGPVDAAGRVFGAAAFEVVEGLGVGVEVFFGPGRVELALVGPLDAVPAVAAVGGGLRHTGS